MRANWLRDFCRRNPVRYRQYGEKQPSQASTRQQAAKPLSYCLIIFYLNFNNLSIHIFHFLVIGQHRNYPCRCHKALFRRFKPQASRFLAFVYAILHFSISGNNPFIVLSFLHAIVPRQLRTNRYFLSAKKIAISGLRGAAKPSRFRFSQEYCQCNDILATDFCDIKL